MAKGLMICYKNKPKMNLATLAETLALRLRPDNATINPGHSQIEPRLFSYVFNPMDSVARENASFCLGITTGETDKLFEVNSARPDGTFALFRAKQSHLEVLSDYVASRTIWYYHDDNIFVAATSQRMIVSVLGDFQPNKLAASWMLSSGVLGPRESWDKRLKHLPGNSRLLLDRSTWELYEEDNSRVDFVSAERTREEHRDTLAAAVEQTMQALDIGNEGWTLALSGGMDSRGIVHYLRDSAGLNTVTWGTSDSMPRADSDANIAKKLADVSGLPHHYAVTNFEMESVASMLDRFLIAGEGRVDHISGYMDGLKLWSDLSATQRSIIRGYDAFGRKPPVTNDYQCRRASGLIVASDYEDNIIPEEYSIDQDALQDRFQRRPGESDNHWRDRLWLEARTPFVTAALDDIKVAYVEIVNPLLCRKVVEAVKSLPEELRINKAVWEEIVKAMYPGIPFAGRDSVEAVDDILAGEEAKSFLREQLLSAVGSGVLPDDFLTRLAQNLDRGRGRVSFVRKLIVFAKARLPLAVENLLRKNVREGQQNIRRLALRTLIVVRMHQMLTEDAAAGKDAMGST